MNWFAKFIWPDTLLVAPWIEGVVCVRNTELQMAVGEGLVPYGQVLSVVDARDNCAVIEVSAKGSYAIHVLRPPHRKSLEMLSLLHDYYVRNWFETMANVHAAQESSRDAQNS